MAGAHPQAQHDLAKITFEIRKTEKHFFRALPSCPFRRIPAKLCGGQQNCIVNPLFSALFQAHMSTQQENTKTATVVSSAHMGFEDVGLLCKHLAGQGLGLSVRMIRQLRVVRGLPLGSGTYHTP